MHAELRRGARCVAVLALAFPLAACVDDAPPARARRVSGPATPTVTAAAVNGGTHGMTSTLRWALSPDSSALLVLDDAMGVENDPVPDGLWYGSETSKMQLQVDSVWDAVPSPGWDRIAYSRALIAPASGDSVTDAAWSTIARRSSLDAGIVRAGSFASSGMTAARAIAQPVLVDVGRADTASIKSPSLFTRALPVTGGWRLLWTRSGDVLVMGANPARAMDDEPASGWTGINAATGANVGAVSADSLADPRWIIGPSLDVSTPAAIRGGPPIRVQDGSRIFEIESGGGNIRMIEIRGGVRVATESPLTIGPGRALAATRGGRYILALTPDPRAKRFDVPVHAVVFTVAR